MLDYRQGSIWLVNFEPSIGTKIRKTRPGLIISGSDFNKVRKKVTLSLFQKKTLGYADGMLALEWGNFGQP